MKDKGFFRLNYESQIRVSLVIFIIFLLLLNFGTDYLLHRAKRVLESRIHQHLTTVALSAGFIWRNSPKTDLKKNLLELCFDSGVRQISSPWMGSKRKATVFGVIAAFKASASPYGIITNPGVNGPKSCL